MKAKRIILCVAVVFLAGILAYSAIQRKHTFTLSNEDGGVTVLGAVIIYAFQALAKSNLPYIADFISDIIDIIEKTRK